MASKPDRFLMQTKVTDPGPMAHPFDPLPNEVPELVEIVQGLLLHVNWAKRYGAPPTQEQLTHVQTRLVSRILETIQSLDPSPLSELREDYGKRFFGNCRDFSVLLTSILRHKGIPARARCGFGTYFLPGHYEDHWICEYWNKERWVAVDAQLDDFQRQTLGIDFDTLDLPNGKFVNASTAWVMCRREGEDPAKFGIFDMHGLWFVRGNLIRELAALCEAEMLPWDVWGLQKGEDDKLSRQDYDLLDNVADALIADSEELYALYRKHSNLQVPPEMIVQGR